MEHQHLFHQSPPDRKALVGLIGAGNYGTGVVTQASLVSELEITAIADQRLKHAKQAYNAAGISADNISVCEDKRSALAAIESGKRVITADPMLLMELPIDVIVESTGSPESGAHHAHEAIRHGKHVVMVTKEADVSVGPILKHLADEAGVVYSTPDGDQHGLLMGLISWARRIGLEVICGGKARNKELCYEPVGKTLSEPRTRENISITLSEEEVRMFEPIPDGQATEYLGVRREILARFGSILQSDKAEMTIAANAMGLSPHVPSLHCPVLYTSEIPKVLCRSEDNGILDSSGIIELITCLRYPHEVGLGGGVFIVVDSLNEYSRGVLSGGIIASQSDGHAFLLTRPSHLRGVETLHTIFAAALRGVATGAVEYFPRYDIVLKARRALEAGQLLDTEDTSVLIMPAVPVKDGAPLPAYMVEGNALAVAVAKGELITCGKLVPPSDSVLWSLRAEQDQHFLS